MTGAGKWLRWAFRRKVRNEAAKAYSFARRSGEQLFRTQLIRRDKELWQKEIQGTAAQACYAPAKTGRIEESTTAAEQGRAYLLTESLAFHHAILTGLKRTGNGDLTEGSDIDLAVMNNGVEEQTVRQLKIDFEESTLPYVVDIVDYPNLKHHIDRIGMIIYKNKKPAETKHILPLPCF